MGAEGYIWVTKYKKNLADALETARMEVFASGKFIGADEHPASIEKAIELGAESGTGSLLDIVTVSEAPEICAVCPVDTEELLKFFDTERPTIEQIEKSASFWASFDRGEARAVTLYENGQPARICFAGWTIDAPAAGNGSFEEARGKKTPIEKNEAPQSISTEERKADLEFFRTFLNDYEKAFNAGQIHHGFQADFQRMTAIFCKYQNDMEFMQSILNLRPDILARAPSGMEKQ